MRRLRQREVDGLRLRAHRRIWAYSALAVLAIVASGIVAARPLNSGRSEDLQVGADDAALAQVTDFRTSLADFQVYLEPHFAQFSANPVAIDPPDLANGSRLGQVMVGRASDVISALNAIGLGGNARAIAAANTHFTKSLAPLAPLAAGGSSATIVATVNGERAAFRDVWTATADASTALRLQSIRDLHEGVDHLDNGRATALAVDVSAVVVILSGGFVLARRARRREILERVSARRRAFETMMQHALEMSKAEPDVYDILDQALRSSVPNLQGEMLVADSSRAHFHQTLSTGAESETERRSGCGVVSPLDCPAARRGHTLVFPTSRALDACPYLKGRASGDCSAVCVAISLSGKTVGVLHATGPDATPPTDGDVRYLEITSRRASERIAMLRAFERSEAQARSDPLTGLWNRRNLENRVHDLHREGIPYALAYGDLDHFKALNDTHGHEAGDQALRLFSRVLRDSIRPHDIAARYGGEEFVIVLPDSDVETANMILERLRERLALTLTTGRVPAFTVSFGLASSRDADTFDEVVAVADQALLNAKTEGRNRTVLAAEPSANGSPIRQP